MESEDFYLYITRHQAIEAYASSEPGKGREVILSVENGDDRSTVWLSPDAARKLGEALIKLAGDK